MMYTEMLVSSGGENTCLCAHWCVCVTPTCFVCTQEKKKKKEAAANAKILEAEKRTKVRINLCAMFGRFNNINTIQPIFLLCIPTTWTSDMQFL